MIKFLKSKKKKGKKKEHGLDELGKKYENVVLHSDSESAIFLIKNSAYHSRTKHIQLMNHFIHSLL
jgi:hypothetical protein